MLKCWMLKCSMFLDFIALLLFRIVSHFLGLQQRIFFRNEENYSNSVDYIPTCCFIQFRRCVSCCCSLNLWSVGKFLLIFREFCHVPKSNATLNCDGIFQIVHKCNADFVAAAMNHSDPFAICTNAYTFTAYRVTLEFYEKLFTTFDVHNTSAACSDKLLNKNHMNVIINFINYSKNLWTSANCDDCYEDPSSSTRNFSSNTESFLESLSFYNDCVQNITTHKLNSSLVCSTCDANYQNLNNIYEHIKKSTGNKICFDLEDKVRR